MVMKDILQVVKEVVVQCKYNFYCDSMVLYNSDFNLYLLVEGILIDWGEQYGDSGDSGGGDSGGSFCFFEVVIFIEKCRCVKQVMFVVQDEELGLFFEVGVELLLFVFLDSVIEF